MILISIVVANIDRPTLIKTGLNLRQLKLILTVF